MRSQTLLYLHGFASTDKGTKASFLRKQIEQYPAWDFKAINFNPTPADFAYMTITGMINRLRQYVLDMRPSSLSLIGSSMGALVGLNYAHRFGGVDRLLLLSPALTYLDRLRTEDEAAIWQKSGTIKTFHFGFNMELPLRYDFEIDGRAYRQIPPPPCPIQILHGRQDRVIPIQYSQEFTDSYQEQVSLMEMDADHTLNTHLKEVWQEVERFFLKTSA